MKPARTATPAAWEPFADEDTLPPITSPGMAAEGCIILDMVGPADTSEFTLMDEEFFL